MQKQLIYFPSLSTFVSDLKKNEPLVNDFSLRFYEDSLKEFSHPYFLLTAGSLYKKKTIRQDLGMEKSLIFGDSGGYQIAMGTLKWDEKLREDIFHWLEDNSDVAMNIDIPPATKNTSFDDCLRMTVDNMEWFKKHQTGKTDFLNVLQIYDDDKTEKWYNGVKHLHFKGWGVGSKNATVVNFCKTIKLFLKNREFEYPDFKWFHFLGKTSVQHFFLYCLLQKKLNEYYPDIQVCTDSSTPAKQAVFGNWYHSVNYRTLSFVNLYFGNKGKTTYKEEIGLPCPLDCPICKEIKFTNIANDNGNKVRYYISYHNLFVMLKGINDITELLECHFDLLLTLIPRVFFHVLESVIKMFDNPEDAERIYTNYLPVYKKFDALFPPNHDEAALNKVFGHVDKDGNVVDEKGNIIDLTEDLLDEGI